MLGFLQNYSLVLIEPTEPYVITRSNFEGNFLRIEGGFCSIAMLTVNQIQPKFRNDESLVDILQIEVQILVSVAIENFHAYA